jgi:hypothetical protein
MKLASVFAGAVLLLGVANAQAACPSPTTVTVPSGQTVHVTPVDQNCTPIAISLCQIINLAPSVATFAYDATGANITGVTLSGATSPAAWSCSSGGITKTVSFTVSVPSPWNVTSVGFTSP